MLPCFFTGATTVREGKRGPFFSGLRIQINPSAPMIAVADPLLACDPDLPIGWYTGLPHTNTQKVITRILAHISSVAHKPLLLIGGSGGGFAAIFYSSMLGDTTRTGSRTAAKSSAFVWNPQISITRYSYVHPYLEVMFPQSAKARGEEAQKLLGEAGITHDLTNIPPPTQLLYIQNKSDSAHINGHTKPYIKAHGFAETQDGQFQRSESQSISIVDYAEGHAPLPRKTTRHIIGVLKKRGLNEKTMSKIQAELRKIAKI